jgi:hypothetical protein
MVRLALVIFSCFCFLSVSASQIPIITESVLLPSPKVNDSLNKEVNFSFKNIMLSEVLLLLAKVGDFNIVLPQELDKTVSVTITHQKVIDAIEDIAKLANLQYKFHGTSLISSNYELNGLQYISIPLSFYKASDMMQILNEGFFIPLIPLLDPRATKPHASLDPSKNSIIVVGNTEQVRYAKEFVSNLDKAPLVKIFTPNVLNIDDIKKIIRANFPKEVRIGVKTYENSSFTLTGDPEAVTNAIAILKEKDQALAPLDLHFEIYALKPEFEGIFQASNYTFKENIIARLNTALHDTQSATSYLGLFEKITDGELILKADQIHNLYGLSLRAALDKIERSSYQIEANEGMAFGDIAIDKLYFLANQLSLAQLKELKKLIKNSNYALIIFEAKAALI